MKLRIGACALVLTLAGCSGGSPDAGVAGMRGGAVAGSSADALPAALPLARAIGASIASAPDRGALLAYPNKSTPAKQEGAYTWYPTAISEEHAYRAVATGEMTVPTPDGSQVKLRYERHVEEIDGNWTWIGRVVGGDPLQEAIITFGEKAVFGSIPLANGKPALNLQTRNGTVFAVETDPSKVVSATKGHNDIMVPEAAALRASMGAAVSQAAQASPAATTVAQGAPPTAANTIDVAVGYTPEFAAANGGASGASTRLVYLIQVGNQAFANSDVNGYLRIVHALQVNYTNTNTNQTALSELTGSNGQSAVTVPASLAPLRTARDQYGADIAVLVRKFNTPENDGCGIAWLNGANQTAITAADAPWGYAVISDGYDQGTDGKTYFCADETLVHEVAHLMGSAHDRANSTNSSGGLQYGRYPYSFGYKTAAASGNFYTVMAYGDTGQVSHRIFSTPLKTTCGGTGNLACGVANSEDNARSLNQTIPIVATFRATVVPFAKSIHDFDGDGRSDILWNNTSTGASSIWKAANYSSQLAVRQVTDLNWKKVGIGDFDGDGKADILFRNSATGANTIWRSGNYSTQTTVATTGTGWQVAGIGDFDGDGRSDILWRNAGTGANVIWKSGSSATQQFVTSVVGNWSVAGVGDFNGDGKADIFWRNTDGSNAIWRSGKYAEYQAVEAVPGLAWQVVGIGDFDGDGMDDVMWRQRSTGQNRIWKGALSAQRLAIADVTDTKWRVASVADYDGDGRADILWRNTGTGANVIWKAASNTSQQAVTAVTSQAWVVVR